MRSSASTPLVDSVPEGNHPARGSPILICASGHVMAPSTTPPIRSARHGWCASQRAQRSQPVGAWYHVSRFASQRGRSIARPRRESTAGRNVTESKTATATTIVPPMPTERVSVVGMIKSDAKPTTTVRPLVTTARPAV